MEHGVNFIEKFLVFWVTKTMGSFIPQYVFAIDVGVTGNSNSSVVCNPCTQ
jgi:hypothetical protein